MSAREQKALKRMAYRRRRARKQDVERWRQNWFSEGRLRIPGVEWEPPEHVLAVYKGLHDDTEGWVLGTKDIPALRHVENDRQMHAVGRRSVAKTLLAICLLMDYRTDNIGTPYLDPATGQLFWFGRSIQTIAQVAGISYWACKRAIQGIVNRGAMSRFEQAGTDADGRVYGRPSVRNINEDLFQCIGQKTWTAFKAARKTASNLWKEAQQAVQATLEAAQRLKEKVKEMAGAVVAKVNVTVRSGMPRELKEYLARHMIRPKPKPDTS